MPDKPTENALVTELAHHLVYSTSGSEKWKEMLSEKCPTYQTMEQRIRNITMAGMKADVSEPLAHLVMLKYAESEQATLTPEQIAAIVRRLYAILGEMTEQQKRIDGYPIARKKH